ncbi:unnamed protein product, partial [Amoebophrya sp. A120]
RKTRVSEPPLSRRSSFYVFLSLKLARTNFQNLFLLTTTFHTLRGLLKSVFCNEIKPPGIINYSSLLRQVDEKKTMASYNENESKSTPHGGNNCNKKRAVLGGAASSLAAGATVVHLLAIGTSVDAALVTTKGQHSTARVGTSAKTTSQRTKKKKTSKKIAAQETHRVLVEHEEKKNLRAGGKSKMHIFIDLDKTCEAIVEEKPCNDHTEQRVKGVCQWSNGKCEWKQPTACDSVIVKDGEDVADAEKRCHAITDQHLNRMCQWDGKGKKPKFGWVFSTTQMQPECFEVTALENAAEACPKLGGGMGQKAVEQCTETRVEDDCQAYLEDSAKTSVEESDVVLCQARLPEEEPYVQTRGPVIVPPGSGAGGSSSPDCSTIEEEAKCTKIILPNTAMTPKCAWGEYKWPSWWGVYPAVYVEKCFETNEVADAQFECAKFGTNGTKQTGQIGEQACMDALDGLSCRAYPADPNFTGNLADKDSTEISCMSRLPKWIPLYGLRGGEVSPPDQTSMEQEYCEKQGQKTCTLTLPQGQSAVHAAGPSAGASCVMMWDGSVGGKENYCTWSGQLLFDKKLGDRLCELAAGFTKKCTENALEEAAQWLRIDPWMYRQFDCTSKGGASGKCESRHAPPEKYGIVVAFGGVGGGATTDPCEAGGGDAATCNKIDGCIFKSDKPGEMKKCVVNEGRVTEICAENDTEETCGKNTDHDCTWHWEYNEVKQDEQGNWIGGYEYHCMPGRPSDYDGLVGGSAPAKGEGAGADPASFSFMRAYCNNQTTKDTCQLDALSHTDNPVSCLWQWNSTAGDNFCRWSGQLLFDENIGNPICAAGFALKGEKECTGNLFDDFRQWLRDPDGTMYAQFDCRVVVNSAGGKACVSVHSDDYQIVTAMGVGGGANPQQADLSAFDSLVSSPLEEGCKTLKPFQVIECEETDVDDDGKVDCQLGNTIEDAILLPLQENPQPLPSDASLLELGSSSSSRRSTKTGDMPPPQCYSGQRLMAALLGCPAYGGGTGVDGKAQCETALAASCKATFDDAIPRVDGKWNLTAYPDQTIKCVSKLPNPKPMFGAKPEGNDIETIITVSPPLSFCAGSTEAGDCERLASCSWDNINNVCKPKIKQKVIGTPMECRDVNTNGMDMVAAEKACNGLTTGHWVMGVAAKKCVWGDANTLEKGWMVKTAQFIGKCFEAEEVHLAHYRCLEQSNIGVTTAEKVENCISANGGGWCQANSDDIDPATFTPTETADISCTSRLPEWQEAYDPRRLPPVKGCILLDVPAVQIEH